MLSTSSIGTVMASYDGKPLTGSAIPMLPDRRAYNRNFLFHICLFNLSHATKASFTSTFQPATQLHDKIALNSMSQLTRPNPDPFHNDNSFDSYDDPQEEEYHDYLREYVTQSPCYQDTC